LIRYYLPGSVIVITGERDEKTNKLKSDKWAARSVPAYIEGDWLRTIEAQRGTFSETQLAVTYVPNTNIISKLGVAVTDQSKTFITAVGSVAAAAATIGLLGFDGGAPGVNVIQLPLTIDATTKQMPAQGVSEKLKCKDGKGHEFDCGNIKYGTVSVDSISKRTYFEAETGKWTSTIAVPACRRVSITIEAVGGNPKKVDLETVINDPTFVRVAKLPSKGNISFHTSCGFDIATDDAKSESAWSLIDALGTQVKAYEDAKAKQNQSKTTK
jgi:hypothetical protein